MTIGEKIYELRNMAGISQEELAEKISVSRQSVSKWEMNQALPQIDKVLQLCDLFGISTDTLLQDNLSVAPKKKTGNKYFAPRSSPGARTPGIHLFTATTSPTTAK